ncbi:MAG: hypothetical protein O2977_01315 [Cyanobacteria bacterium]|jgi:hypothetical protein|uniref:hypothetical protein n=1 Tax=Cyanobium sp. BA20m-p-22 TaxID=2823704 RepID=UPI0020CE57A2|nr:hypothetical protein [Cyanobium sp. BA20m-p-22]MCP9910823.1 hypothetical protein [Cyanobium sp. BA20m-p-22]MDA0886289.1 hypothetical protein [Cyanobacteriota bacterium]
MPAPINLSEAALDLAQGDYGDLDAAEYLLEYAVVMQPPYLVAGVGLAIGVLCGLTFAKLVENKLEGWKQDRLALLPLGSYTITLPYFGVVIGITLFIGGSLQVFGFSAGVALLVSFVLSIATAGALWVQLERLMGQVEDGTFSAVDFDNFDQFF